MALVVHFTQLWRFLGRPWRKEKILLLLLFIWTYLYVCLSYSTSVETSEVLFEFLFYLCNFCLMKIWNCTLDCKKFWGI